MGMSLSEGSGDDDDFAENHEINVTPFIDVILVLLIIFMVAAPLSTVDIPVNLPSSTATPQPKPEKPTYISIKSDLALAIGDDMVKRVDLIQRLDALIEGNKDRPIAIRVDRGVPYGEFFEIFERLRKEGYRKLNLTTLQGIPDVPGGAPGPKR